MLKRIFALIAGRMVVILVAAASFCQVSPAQAQSVAKPLYLRCEAPNARKDQPWRDVIFEITDQYLASWVPDQGRFVNMQGANPPTFELSPLKIVWSLWTDGYLVKRVQIDRRTGAYHLEKTWFGKPDDDSVGSCRQIEKPKAPETRF